VKRRGFLGFLGGAAVAGPSMVKQAASARIADLNVASLSGGIGLPPWGDAAPNSSIGPGGDHAWEITRLTKLLSRSAEQHDWHRKRMMVQALDPDLGSYRSMALHHKIRQQRVRNYAREFDNERTGLEAAIAGWFDL
jgi:hypothetical protein